MRLLTKLIAYLSLNKEQRSKYNQITRLLDDINMLSLTLLKTAPTEISKMSVNEIVIHSVNSIAFVSILKSQGYTTEQITTLAKGELSKQNNPEPLIEQSKSNVVKFVTKKDPESNN